MDKFTFDKTKIIKTPIEIDMCFKIFNFANAPAFERCRFSVYVEVTEIKPVQQPENRRQISLVSKRIRIDPGCLFLQSAGSLHY